MYKGKKFDLAKAMEEYVLVMPGDEELQEAYLRTNKAFCDAGFDRNEQTDAAFKQLEDYIWLVRRVSFREGAEMLAKFLTSENKK